MVKIRWKYIRTLRWGSGFSNTANIYTLGSEVGKEVRDGKGKDPVRKRGKKARKKYHIKNVEEELRWWRNRTGRPLSPLQINQKNNLTLSKFHKTTSDR